MMETVAPLAGAARVSERGWRGFVLALALVLASAVVALWPPALGLVAAGVALLVPLPEPLGVLSAGVAACAIAAWVGGGRTLMVLIWSALALWSMLEPVPTGATADFDRLARGWTLAAASGFGFAHLLAVGRRFISRALVAVGVATLVTVGAIAVRDVPIGRVVEVSQAAVGTRVGAILARWRSHFSDPQWVRFATAQPDLAERAYEAGRAIERAVPTAARLAPALAALETLLILGVAWSAFHRISRVRVGAPLAVLARFRFNDQLIWGVVVGGVLALLPTFAEWQVMGTNLLLFFGALYGVRGGGVVAGWASDRMVAIGAVVLLLAAGVIGAPAVLIGAAGTAVALGLSDTWRDWRGLSAPR
jgi:hypothetical protein